MTGGNKLVLAESEVGAVDVGVPQVQFSELIEKEKSCIEYRRTTQELLRNWIDILPTDVFFYMYCIEPDGEKVAFERRGRSVNSAIKIFNFCDKYRQVFGRNIFRITAFTEEQLTPAWAGNSTVIDDRTIRNWIGDFMISFPDDIPVPVAF